MIRPEDSYGIVHDSTILHLLSSGRNMLIQLEDIDIDYDAPYMDCHYATINIRDIGYIYRNGDKVDSVVPEIISGGDYGGMVAADQKNDRVTLIINWHRFKPRESEVVVYDLMGAKLSLELFQHPHDEGHQTPPATDN